MVLNNNNKENNMEHLTLKLRSEPTLLGIVAEFYSYGKIVIGKRLTDVEMENLSTFEDRLNTYIPLKDIVDEQDKGFWLGTDDGDSTHFDQIMANVIASNPSIEEN